MFMSKRFNFVPKIFSNKTDLDLDLKRLKSAHVRTDLQTCGKLSLFASYHQLLLFIVNCRQTWESPTPGVGSLGSNLVLSVQPPRLSFRGGSQKLGQFNTQNVIMGRRVLNILPSTLFHFAFTLISSIILNTI